MHTLQYYLSNIKISLVLDMFWQRKFLSLTQCFFLIPLEVSTPKAVEGYGYKLQIDQDDYSLDPWNQTFAEQSRKDHFSITKGFRWGGT